MYTTCVRCGRDYYARGPELGRWQCRIHPGHVDVDSCAYTCCGARPGAYIAAGRGLLPLHVAHALRPEDEAGGGCLAVDHCCADDGVRVRADSVALVRTYRLPPAAAAIPRAAVLASTTLPLANGQQPWTVAVDYVGPYGTLLRRTETLDVAKAEALRRETYADPAFAAYYMARENLATVRQAVQNARHAVIQTYAMTDAEVLSAYWQADVSQGPNVDVQWVRQAAPARLGDVVARGALLATV